MNTLKEYLNIVFSVDYLTKAIAPALLVLLVGLGPIFLLRVTEQRLTLGSGLAFAFFYALIGCFLGGFKSFEKGENN